MKKSFLLALILSASALFAGIDTVTNNKTDTVAHNDALEAKVESLEKKLDDSKSNLLEKNKTLLISVVGQGVAPMNTTSPAQAYALAKRAAISDGYRLIAEKVKGVEVDGQDTIKNMMVQRSTIRTAVNAMIKNANVVETTFKEGLCEVEMEINIAYSHFVQ